MSRRKKKAESDLSIKSRRLLEGWGVERALAEGANLVPVGPTCELADGRTARLAFTRDDEGRLCVGYAADKGGEWELIDSRPYAARTLGYFRRRLRRASRREDDSNGEPEPEQPGGATPACSARVTVRESERRSRRRAR